MNRKISITWLFLVLATLSFAQKTKVANALTFQQEGDLKTAYETIQEALNPENPKAVKKTLYWAGTWEVKASILYDIHKAGIRNIVFEPLLESYKAYNRAIELDTKNRMLAGIKEDLHKMQPDLTDMAVKAFKLGRFDVALEAYQKYFEIADLPLLKDEEPMKIDTAIYYNAGLAAFSSKSWPNAIQFFSKTAHNNKYGEDSYFYLYGVYQAMSDTLKQYETLKEAFNKYPESENINIELVKFCIATERPDEAIDYIDFAIKRSPDNATFYTLKGRALEDAGNDNDAIEAYLKAIELDANLFVPTYNLAVIYYNRGVYFINKAIKLPQDKNDEYDQQVAIGTLELVKGLPLFEKAKEIQPNDEKVNESLKFIYSHMEKTNNIN
ncbi:MAG: tetratricopeptide repeat protein [Prolixibacteraceae bacterium]